MPPALRLAAAGSCGGMAWRAAASATAVRVFLTDVDGAIGVATTRQIARAIEEARTEQARALIVRLDTPGGLVSRRAKSSSR